MKNLSILLFLSLVTACASPVSHFITEDDFNKQKKFESEVDTNFENKIDKNKIKEFEESLGSLNKIQELLTDVSDYSTFITAPSIYNHHNHLENEYNMFLEKKEQLNQELKIKEVHFNIDDDKYYYEWKNKEEATKGSGLIFSTPDELIKDTIENLKTIATRIESLKLEKLSEKFEKSESLFIFLEKEPQNFENLKDKAGYYFNNVFFDYDIMKLLNNSILTLHDYNGNKLTTKELEAKDIPELNKKIQEYNLFVYIEPNFYYTDGKIGEYQALKKLNSFKTPAKSSTYSGKATDDSGEFKVNISTDYNYNNYDYNDTFLITGGLPDKTNFNNGIILKLNKVDRPKAGSKKYLIFDFVGYYKQKETQKLKIYYHIKENPVVYANNNTFNKMYLTTAEIQKLTTAYNFSLTILELNTLIRYYKIENEIFIRRLEEFTDLKEPASSLNNALINNYNQTVADSKNIFNKNEKRYLNQYNVYGNAYSTNCFLENNNYIDYSNCLEDNAGKASHYIFKPLSCLPFVLYLGIGYPLCILIPSSSI